MALTDEELKIVTYIDQFYWENDGKTPTNEIVAERLRIPVGRVNKCWKNTNFRQAVLARGINLVPEEDEGILTPSQVMLANMLMNVHDKASIREKLKMLNISTQQYTAWMNDPTFQKYIRNRAEKAFSSTDPIAYNKLIQAIDGGDLQAIKLFFEMRGIYNPRMDISVNIEGVLQRVIEVVSRHVTPEVLADIADELEGLTGQPARLESAVEIPSRELSTGTLGF